MHLTRVQLTGFRGFREAVFDLRHPDGGALPVVALVGPNGCGKSSALTAIAGALTALHPAYGGPALTRGDILTGHDHGEITVHFDDGLAHVVSVRADARGPWTLHETAPVAAWRARLDDAPSAGLAIALDAHRLLPPVDVRDLDDRRIVTAPRDNALAPSLQRGHTRGFRFAHLEQWIVNLDHLRARARADHGRAFPLWEVLVQGLDEMLAPVRFEGVDETLTARFATPTGSVPLQSLSDGFRSVFVLIAELVLRLSLATDDPYAALDQSAVCLIDELDAHLHPRWQSQILRGLQRLFPRVQFVVTTHSPFVVAALEPHAVFRLGDIDP